MENVILLFIGLFTIFIGTIANSSPTKPDTVKIVPRGKGSKQGASSSDPGPPAPVDKALLTFGSSSTKNDPPALTKDIKTTNAKPSVPKSPDVKNKPNVKQPAKTKPNRSKRRRRRRKRKQTRKPSKSRKRTKLVKPKKVVAPKSPTIVFEPFPTTQKKSSAKSTSSNALPERRPSSIQPKTVAQKKNPSPVSVSSLKNPLSPSASILKKDTSLKSKKSPSTVIAAQANTDVSSVRQSKQNTLTEQMSSTLPVSKLEKKAPALSSGIISSNSPQADIISQRQMNVPSQSGVQNRRSFLTQRFGPIAKLMMMADQNEAQSEMPQIQRMLIRMPGGFIVQQGLIQKAVPRNPMTNLDVLFGSPQSHLQNIQTAEILGLPSAAKSTVLKGKGVHSPIEMLHKSMSQGPQVMNAMVDMSKTGASQQTEKDTISQRLPDTKKTNPTPKKSSTNTIMPNKGDKTVLSPLEILQRSFLREQGTLPMEIPQLGPMSMGPMSFGHMPMESFNPMVMGPLQGLLSGGAPGVPQIPESAALPLTLSQSANASISSAGPNIMNVMQQRIQRDLCINETPLVIRSACSLSSQPTSPTKPQCKLNMICVEVSPGIGGCCARDRRHANMLDDWVERNLPERYHT